VFNGRVRNSEQGDPIIGIEYECYDGMAQKELQKLAEETAEKFRISDLDCIHRVGYVPIGEASLRVVIWSKHRVEGLDAMAWFISEMKERVPIWKHAVLPDGSKLAQ
jgi:molybdopterin synthase catalytic subunit